jgi:membrane protein implicated in regulation of membrane protease activity
MEFFNEMEPLLRTFWYIAIPASLIFIIQTIMTFVGGDATDGLDADFDGDLGHGGDTTFQLFSLRNLVNFLLGFGWGGISFYSTITNSSALIAVATIAGLVFLFMFFLVIRQIQKLAEDNSFQIEETINKTAEVYLNIPAHKSGKGKVLVSIKGSTRELDAMTENEKINSGAVVRVLRVDSDILIVEPV